AVQENDGVALSDLNICHLVAQDSPALLLERKVCRDHDRFSFRPNSIGLTIARLYTIILMRTGVELFRKVKNCRVVALEGHIHSDYLAVSSVIANDGRHSFIGLIQMFSVSATTVCHEHSHKDV